MTTYHYSPRTKSVGVCRAEKRKCSLVPEEDDFPVHFKSKEEANEWFMKKIESDDNNKFSTYTKNSSFSTKPKTFKNSQLLEKHKDLSKEQQKTLLRFSKQLNTKIPVMSQEVADTLCEKMFNERASEKHTEQETISLKRYSRTSYEYMNPLLRNGLNDKEIEKLKSNLSWISSYENSKLTEQVNGEKEALNNIIEKGRKEHTTEPREVYRYIPVPKGTSVEDFAKSFAYKPIFEDEGFMSTTEDPALIAAVVSSSKKHEPDKEYIALQILTNDGVSLQYDKNESELNIQSFEKERLLPTNKKFATIESKTKNFNISKDREKIIKKFSSYGVVKNVKIPVVTMIDMDLLS